MAGPELARVVSPLAYVPRREDGTVRPVPTARKLRALCDEFGPLSRDHRVAALGAEIAALSTP